MIFMIIVANLIPLLDT